MPLLDMVGCTSLHTTFYVALVFLSAERQEDYIWALTALNNALQKHEIIPPAVVLTDREAALINALGTVIPTATNLLCCWHINKNIAAHCKAGLSAADWARLERDLGAIWSCTSTEAFNQA